MYFMLTACGRPQGGGSGSCGQVMGVKNTIFCGRHKWMAPVAKVHLRSAKLILLISCVKPGKKTSGNKTM